MVENDEVVRRFEFVYDAVNRRIEMVTDDTPAGGVLTSQSFAYDGQDVALEYHSVDGATPDLDAVNLFGPGTDQVLAVDDSDGQVLWLLADAYGTVRDVAHDEGTLANHITLDSFGNVIEQTDESFAVRYLLAGREYDAETGLYYLRARYLDPVTGRFISTDPLGPIGGDINGYRYALNSPIQLSDPTGLLVGHMPVAWGSGYQPPLLSEGAQFAMQVAGELDDAVGRVWDTLKTTATIGADFLAISVQATAGISNEDFVTIGDYWQREFRGEEQIEDLLPALGGVIASSVGAVAGFAVGGPGGDVARRIVGRIDLRRGSLRCGHWYWH